MNDDSSGGDVVREGVRAIEKDGGEGMKRWRQDGGEERERWVEEKSGS